MQSKIAPAKTSHAINLIKPRPQSTEHYIQQHPAHLDGGLADAATTSQPQHRSLAYTRLGLSQLLNPKVY